MNAPEGQNERGLNKASPVNDHESKYAAVGVLVGGPGARGDGVIANITNSVFSASLHRWPPLWFDKLSDFFSANYDLSGGQYNQTDKQINPLTKVKRCI
jgi:hypothetical protein